MLLNELCRAAGTTRKAVAYYEEQGLISPRRQENGYREFTPEDAQRVRRITLLRRLELSVEEIRGVLDGPEPEQVLRASLREKEGQARRLEACRDGLRLLIRKGADSREAEETISRLLVECESAARRLQAGFSREIRRFHLSSFRPVSGYAGGYPGKSRCIYRYYRFSGQSGGDPHAGGTGRAASVGL